MNACDFYAVVYEGAVYCVGCLEGVAVDNDPDVAPIFADSEWDSYPTCDTCHAEHDYVCLTSDGLTWAREREWSPKMRAFSQDCRDHKIPIPCYTPFGQYPIVYFDKQGETYCGKCAARTDRQLSLQEYGAHWEGAPIECAECLDAIESAYGEPDAPEAT